MLPPIPPNAEHGDVPVRTALCYADARDASSRSITDHRKAPNLIRCGRLVRHAGCLRAVRGGVFSAAAGGGAEEYAGADVGADAELAGHAREWAAADVRGEAAVGRAGRGADQRLPARA